MPTQTDQQPTSAVQQAVNAIAEQIGENAANIHVRNTFLVKDPSKLAEAVLVDLTIGRPRFEIKLSYEMLGLHPENAEQRRAMDRTLSMPRGFLKPKSVLHKYDSIENRARGLLDNPDLVIKTMFGRLVPAANYLQLKAQLNELQRQYFAQADKDCSTESDVETNWDDQYRIMFADWTLHGLRVHHSLLEANMRAKTAGQPLVAPDLPEDEIRYAKEFAHRVLANLPSPSAARAGYTFEWSVEYVPPVTMLAQDQVAAQQVITDAQLLSEEQRALAKARAEMKADAEKNSLAKRDELVERLYKDVAGHIHDRVFAMTMDVFEALKKNDGAMPPSNQRQLAKILEAVRSLNIFDDEALNKQEQDIRLLMASKPVAKSGPGSYLPMLERISAQSQLALLQLGRPPTRTAREFGVPDTVPELEDMLAARAPRKVRVQLKPAGKGLQVAMREPRNPRQEAPAPVAAVA